VVIVDYKEYGSWARQEIRWDRTRLDDDKDPNGKIDSVQWGINNNPRCFRVWSQAWDEGNSQTGVNYVHFFAGYNGGNSYWKHLGYEFNDNVDNIYTQTHCLPDNIPSGTDIQLSIHIVDRSGRYRYNGSEGNKWSKFAEALTDKTYPVANMNQIKPINVPGTVQAILSVDSYDPASPTNSNEPRTGVKSTKFFIQDQGGYYQQKEYRTQGNFAGSTFKEIPCIRNCNTDTPFVDLCSTSGICAGSFLKYANLGIQVEDNAGNTSIHWRSFQFNTPASGYVSNNDPTFGDMMWQGMVDRGAKAGDYPSIVKAAINLAFDFLIANDFNACFGMDINGWERVFGCVATALNGIGIGKLAGILAKITKVKALVRAGESVDKFRDAYKTILEIDGLGEFCKVASVPSFVDRILGTVKAEAALCLGWLDNINLGHIVDRHAWNSAYQGVSKFAKGEDLLNLTKIGLTQPVVRTANAGGRTKKIVEMGRIIGTDISGQSTTKLFLVIDDTTNKVITSFPVDSLYVF
jgi:hypothetical protein